MVDAEPEHLGPLQVALDHSVFRSVTYGDVESALNGLMRHISGLVIVGPGYAEDQAKVLCALLERQVYGRNCAVVRLDWGQTHEAGLAERLIALSRSGVAAQNERTY